MKVSFTFLDKEIPTDSRIYIFSDKENDENKHECFLMQSYLDVVMEGFLNYGKKKQSTTEEASFECDSVLDQRQVSSDG